jgi:hypothetical protein
MREEDLFLFNEEAIERGINDASAYKPEQPVRFPTGINTKTGNEQLVYVWECTMRARRGKIGWEDDTMMDKMSLYYCRAAPMPMSTDTLQERNRFAVAIRLTSPRLTFSPSQM